MHAQQLESKQKKHQTLNHDHRYQDLKYLFQSSVVTQLPIEYLEAIKINLNEDQYKKMEDEQANKSFSEEKIAPVKLNGFHRPFHPLQVSSWIILPFNVLFFYSLFLPQFLTPL